MENLSDSDEEESEEIGLEVGFRDGLEKLSDSEEEQSWNEGVQNFKPEPGFKFSKLKTDPKFNQILEAI